MSPPAGTDKPSGSSKKEMSVGFDEMKAFDKTAYDTLPDEDRISWHEDDEDLPTAPLPASAVSNQPLSASPAMDAALAEISSGAPASRTRRDERRPARGVDSYTILKQNYEARLQVEADKKAEADRIAATGQGAQPRPDKRDRTVSSESRSRSSKKAKGKQPAQDPNVMDMRQEGPAKNRPTSFAHLHKSGRTWCAVMIDTEEIMGNPFAHTPGWDVKVSLDPGTLGQPSVGLSFRFSKDGSDTSRKDEDYNNFAVDWEPGVQVGGQWMMEDLQCFPATNPADRELIDFTFPPAIRNLLDGFKNDKKKAEMASRLVCATFKSNVHRTSPVDPNWALALKDGAGQVPYDNLARMYSGEDPSYQVTMWFLSRDMSLENFYSKCLGPLSNAVADHTPPFHQYLDENDEPFIDYRLPTIHDIGDGMYRRYPKVKDHTGNKIEDKSVAPTYFNLPKTVTWDSIKTFHTTFGVPIVRDMQYTDGLHVRLERDWHRVFIQRMPAYDPEGKILLPEAKMKDTYRAGIRMTRDPKTGLKDAVPPEGSVILFEFHNGSSKDKRDHQTLKEDICFGRISNYGGKAWLEETKTDFCVILTRPRHMIHRPPTFPNTRCLKDSQLPMAKLKVKPSHEPAIRDMRGFAKFCDKEYRPELLDRIRLAFQSDPSKSPEDNDLTMGPAHSRSEANRENYAAILEELQKKRSSNASQRKVLQAASRMKDRIVAVQGPPGAGKTRTLRDKVIALTKIGHKTLCVASSNVAVDTDATAVWLGLDPEERKKIKCLRLETDGAEKQQRLSKAGYAQYTGKEGEADELPKYFEQKEARDNPAIRNSLDKLCMEWNSRQEYAAQMFKKYEDLNSAYQAMQNYSDLKQSNVPNGMTLDHRIWEITDADMRKAEADYKEARDRLSPEEFHRLLERGEISVGMFDNSRRYRECISNYIAKQGKVSKAERVALEDETDKMTERVLADTDILFTTASNCGGALLEESEAFQPTVIFCDEAGQISVPSLCVPLTNFKKWEGLFLFGDIQQLEPTALSGHFNEFIANAKVSPLALLAVKGFESYLLDEQYRMAPACSSFPRMQFYDGKGLKDSSTVKVDNDVRRTVRELSRRLGVVGDNKQGSEYFLSNVSHGCSRVEVNGTSLVNHANADAIVSMIDRLIKTKVVQASMIKVLTYYQGQRRLLRRKINETQMPRAIKDAIEISTVDSFQGREARVVLVDTVAAKDKLASRITNDDTPEDAEDFGGEDYVKAGVVTRHVRSPNRLNVALTRGKDATIVFCQATLLASTLRPNRGKQYNAIANMICDAKERKCWLEDDTEDTHPESVDVRANMGQQKVQEQRETERQQALGFVPNWRSNWRTMKKLPAIPAAEPFQHYRNPQGHTTRPIGDPKLVEEADAFDEEQREINRAKAESLAIVVAEEENQRTLELGIRQSLGSSEFPALPRARGAATSERPSAKGTNLDGGKQDSAESESDVGFDSMPENEDEDAGGEESGEDDRPLPEYEGAEAGTDVTSF